MPTFESRVFGTLPVKGEEFTQRKTTVRGHQRKRSLHVWVTDQALLDRAAALVDDIDTLDLRARAAIDAARKKRNKIVLAFVGDQLKELDESTLVEVFGAEPPLIDHETFLAKLDLVTVAVRPDEEGDGGFVLVFDYSLPGDVSDELLVVQFTSAGEPVDIRHES